MQTKACSKDSQTGEPTPALDVSVSEDRVVIETPDGDHIMIEYYDHDSKEHGGLKVWLIGEHGEVILNVTASELFARRDELGGEWQLQEPHP